MGLWEQMQRVEEQKALRAAMLTRSQQPSPAGRALKEAKDAQEVAKRGPKPSGKAKKLITLRLDPDVIEGFKSSGEGWQARINAVLRTHLGL